MQRLRFCKEYLDTLGISGEALRSHLELLLLAVLADVPAHGYLIIDALRQRSGGHLDVPEGTLYPALHRLERVGLVRSTWDEAVEGGQRRRRIYELTPAGMTALRTRRRDWEHFAASMAGVLGEVSAAGRT